MADEAPAPLEEVEVVSVPPALPHVDEVPAAPGPPSAADEAKSDDGPGPGPSSSASASTSASFVGARSGLLIEVSGAERKAYMGGLRDKETGRVFHHAVVQAAPPPVSKWANAPERFSRDSQTPMPVTRSQQMKREGAAQTLRRDLHHDAARDGTRLQPRPYVSSVQAHEVRSATATQIQCQWRGALARRRAKEVRAAQAAAAAALEAEEDRAGDELRARQQADLQRRMHPRTPEDFGVLFDEVEAWRLVETRRIDAELPLLLRADGLPETDSAQARARHAAHVAMQAKEAQLVATIERLRLVAAKENNEARTRGMIDRMAGGKSLLLSNGDSVRVETPASVRGAELKLLFDALSLPPGACSREQRLATVQAVRACAVEFAASGSALVGEIAMLCDRETDLLGRGRPQGSMEGLRARLRSMFTAFVNEPAFNLGAADFGRRSAREGDVVASFMRTAAATSGGASTRR